MSDTERQIISVLDSMLKRAGSRLTGADFERDIRMLLDMLHEFRQPQQKSYAAQMSPGQIEDNINEMKRIAKLHSAAPKDIK